LLRCIGCSRSAAAQLKGPELGIGTGYSLPFGDIAIDAAEMDDIVSRAVPIIVDAGYRILPKVMIGAFFQYGFGSLGSDYDRACVEGFECKVRNLLVL
jgi:hypothetical protein